MSAVQSTVSINTNNLELQAPSNHIPPVPRRPPLVSLFSYGKDLKIFKLEFLEAKLKTIEKDLILFCEIFGSMFTDIVQWSA